MSADTSSVYMRISKIIQIWGGRRFVAVEIQKNLLSPCGFYLKNSRVHVFYFLIQVRMFYDDNRSILVPQSTRSGVS